MGEKTYRVKVVSYKDSRGRDVDSALEASQAVLMYLDGDKCGDKENFSIAFARNLDLKMGDELDYSVEN